MITKLSNAQYNALSSARLSYISHILQHDTFDEIGLGSSIHRLYRSAGLPEMPKVFIVSGPREAVRVINYLKGYSGHPEIQADENLVFANYEDAVEVSAQLHSCVSTISAMAWQTLKSQIDIGLIAELRNMLFKDLNLHLCRKNAYPVKDCVHRYINNYRLKVQWLPALHPSLGDADWCGFMEILSRCLHLDMVDINAISSFYNSGGLMLCAFDQFAVAILQPLYRKVDQNFNLHCETGPALEWRDGIKTYMWHGVEIPAKLIERPDKVTKEEIIRESNAEVRRCYQEVLGSQAFGRLLGIIELDSFIDHAGHKVELCRTVEVDIVAREFIYFIRVVCPSTGRPYTLCVPPTMETARQALAWTFGKTMSEYYPDIET